MEAVEVAWIRNKWNAFPRRNKRPRISSIPLLDEVSKVAANTRLCPVCFSEIDARAKKCPQCHSPLGIYKFGAAVLVFIFVFGGIGFLALITWGLSRPRKFETVNHAAEVKTVTSKTYFAPGAQNGMVATIVGALRNDGNETIKSVYLEARFFNANNELIDVFDSSYMGSIKPREETPFKISDGANIHLPEREYASHKLIVKQAYADD
jgi:hypothetical protein